MATDIDLKMIQATILNPYKWFYFLQNSCRPNFCEYPHPQFNSALESFSFIRSRNI